MNIKRLAYKLQTALTQKGRYIKINQHQSYSPKAERMVTKFVVSEKYLVHGKPKDIVIISTYQMADVVKVLEEILKEENDS